jgi:hypothetical protein
MPAFFLTPLIYISQLRINALLSLLLVLIFFSKCSTDDLMIISPPSNIVNLLCIQTHYVNISTLSVHFYKTL